MAWHAEIVLFDADAYLTNDRSSSDDEEKQRHLTDNARKALPIACTGMLDDVHITRARTIATAIASAKTVLPGNTRSHADLNDTEPKDPTAATPNA